MATTLTDTTASPPPHGIKWLILARLAIIVVCIAILVVRSAAQPESIVGTGCVYALLISLAILDTGYLLLLPLIRHGLTVFLFLQFLIDIAAVTGLVFFTGGVQSNFVNLYFVSIMAASMLLSRRNSALFASFATVGLAVVTTLYLTRAGLVYVDPLYHPSPDLSAALRDILVRMLLTVLAFFVLAFLSGLLAERLDMARSLNEEILQNMAEGVAVFDLGGRIVFMNAEFERLFAPGRPIQLGDSADSGFAHAEDEPLRRLVDRRVAARFELLENSQLPARPPLGDRTSILGPAETPRGLVMLAIDLSLQRRAELAERRAERFSAVSEMSAGLAHEIRNPLASVRGSIQEISRDFAEGSPNRRLAEIMMKESDRLDRIITNFLQFARQRPLHPTNCSLSRLLQEVKTLLENRPDAEGITIDLHLAEEPSIRCDAEQMREVFLNLGVNALAALNGKGALTIRYPHAHAPLPDTTRILRRDDSEQGVVVSFTDTGPGMPPGAEERIFEPFYTTKPRGSGLGLALARRVVESHEGRIWVRTKPAQGAAFFVWLPLAGPFTPGAPKLDTGPRRPVAG